MGEAMQRSSAQYRCLFCLAIILALPFSPQTSRAGDADFLSRISPHISLNKNVPSQELRSFSSSAAPQVDGYQGQGGNYLPSPKKSINDQDLFSLALGARFQISEWLGVDAACAMPLAEEETGLKKDLAIEAMLTMQF